MPEPPEETRWRTPRFIAQIWCCDDDLDGLCYQAQIDRVDPNVEAGFPWIRRTEVWRGTFVNDPESGEMEMIRKELSEAAAARRIPMEGEYGEREV